MKKSTAAVLRRRRRLPPCRGSPRRGEGPAPPLQLEQLHRPETVKRFEEQCKCEVVQTYYSDNEGAPGEARRGRQGYDVLVPTSNAVQALIRGNQLKPLDHAKVPNAKNVDPRS